MIEDSLLDLVFKMSNRGIKVRVFNSRPTQLIKREDDDKTRITLKKILTPNKKIVGESHTGKEARPINGA